MPALVRVLRAWDGQVPPVPPPFELIQRRLAQLEREQDALLELWRAFAEEVTLGLGGTARASVKPFEPTIWF